MADQVIKVCDYCVAENEVKPGEVASPVEMVHPETGGTIRADLCARHRVMLEDTRQRLMRFAEVATPVRKQKNKNRPTTVDARTNEEKETDAIRKWGRDHGYVVADHGRIPNVVRQGWEEAGRPGLPAEVREAVPGPPTPGEPVEAGSVDARALPGGVG